MESRRKDSGTAKKDYDPSATLDLKKSAVLRVTTHQLRTEKANIMLTPKNSRVAEVSGPSTSAEDDGDDCEIKSEITGNKVSVKDEAETLDNTFANSSILKATANNSTMRVNNEPSDMEDTGDGSTMAQNASDIDFEGSDELHCDNGRTKESEKTAVLPEGMYLIKAIKGSRLLISGGPQFLIEWMEYPARRDFTWEPEMTLLDAVPEMLAEYYDKIGGRDRVGKKRKYGRPSNVIDANYNLLPKTKKQKIDTEQATDKARVELEDKINDKSNMGAVDTKKPDAKTPSPKKRRGRPAKATTPETAAEGINTSKSVTGIRDIDVEDDEGVSGTVRTGEASSGMVLKNKHLIGTEKVGKTKLGDKVVHGSRGAHFAHAPAKMEDLGKNCPDDSDDDIPNKRPGRQLKVHDQLSPPVGQSKSGKDVEEKVVGGLVRVAGRKTSPAKTDPFAGYTGKKSADSIVRTKESAAGKLSPNLPATAVIKSMIRPAKYRGGSRAKSVGSEALSTVMQRSGEIPPMRKAGCPTKGKGSRALGEDADNENKNNPSPSLALD